MGEAILVSGAGECDRREKRRRAMIDAARALFLERGYEPVSLNDIVKRSGGSLATLYGLFENKAGLLGEIVEAHRFEGYARVDAIIAAGGTPVAMLRAIAGEIYRHFTSAEAVGLTRLVASVALHDRAFSQLVYRVAHERSIDQLASLFARWHDDGAAQIPDPRLAAHFFVGLLVHGAQIRALFKDPCAKPHAPIEHMLDEATRLFLAGYRIAIDG